MEKFHKLARNHYSSYVCDIFLKLSNLQDKKLLMTMLINCKMIGSFDNNNCGKIIMNKLMNGLKQQSINNIENGKKENNVNNRKEEIKK